MSVTMEEPQEDRPDEVYQRGAFLSVCWLVFLLGGGGGLMLLILEVAEAISPGVTYSPLSSRPEAFAVMAVLLVGLVIGAFFGAAVFCFVLRPFLSRSKIEIMFTQPYVPLITPVLTKIFNAIYPN